MSLLDQILGYEIFVNVAVQESFQRFDTCLSLLSRYFSPRMIFDIWLPLAGAFDTGLLVDLCSYMALINCTSSLIKWVYPEYRPFAWTREFDGPEITQSVLTCETTSGFPSGHSMGITGYVYILAMHLTPVAKRLLPAGKLAEWTLPSMVVFVSVMAWISRLYFGCHFLHQCVVGSVMAVGIANFLDGHKAEIFMFSKRTAIFWILGITGFVVAMYFVILKAGYDPHWSVRTAFKWCEDPTYLKHETTPVFSLAHDLGFLAGVALSAPLNEVAQHNLNKKFSIPIVIAVEIANYSFRCLTPKQYGRVMFVGYEVVRNAAHSFTLLSIVPKLCDR